MDNPFSQTLSNDEDDLKLLERIRNGDRRALEGLLRRHQPWIFNIAARMVWDPHDAEDVTQEVLIKVITGLSGFAGRSGFRTWLYRIVVNHVLNMRRRNTEPESMSFQGYGDELDRAPDSELANEGFSAAEIPLLVEETKIGCMMGMLLCLDRRQRLVFTLGEMLGVTDRTGAELMQITPEHFRQLLSRARRDLYNFMNNKCGLVNEKNPCRCARKTRYMISAGFVEPKALRFAADRVRRIEEVAPSRSAELDDLFERRYAELFRQHPVLVPADEADLLRKLLEMPELRNLLDLADGAGAAS